MTPPPPQKVLIIKPSSLGDVVSALPVLRGLARTFPAAQVAWLVVPGCADILRGQPGLDEIIPFDRERFGQMAINMPLSNSKQATITPSAEAIPNEMGTAPGWWVERDGHIIVAMPGPPRELYNIWAKMVRPRLAETSDSILLPRTFKTVGLSEAAVAEMVSPLLSSANPTLGVYAKPDGIYLRLAAKAKVKEQAEKMVAKGEASIRAVLNDYIWGVDDDSMESVVGNMLEEKGLTLAFMEDSSGGLLAAAFSDIAENSSFFKGGLIACTDDAKMATSSTRNPAT